MKKIILDTNFLLIPFTFSVDIFAEFERICDFKYELCILDKTIDELNKIVDNQRGKHKERAKLALQLIKVKRLTHINTGDGNVDDLLLQQDAVIATQDKELVKRLKEKGKKVMQLRQKQYLVLK